MEFLDGVLGAINFVEDVVTPLKQRTARRIFRSASVAIGPYITEVHPEEDGRITERGVITSPDGSVPLVFFERRRESSTSEPNYMIIDVPDLRDISNLATSVTISRRGWRVGVDGSYYGIYLMRNSKNAFRLADEALVSLNRASRPPQSNLLT